MHASFTSYGAVSVFAGPIEDNPLVGITDAQILETSNGPMLFVATRGGGWVTAFELGQHAGEVTTADTFALDEAYLQLETTDLAIRDMGSGQFELYFAGLADDDLIGVNMVSPISGPVFGNALQRATESLDGGDISNIALWESGDGGLVALRGGGLAQISFAPNGTVQSQVIGQGGPMDGETASDIILTIQNGHTIALVSYGDASAISLLRMDGNGVMSHEADLTGNNGLWVSQPGAMTWVTGPNGGQFAVLASAGTGTLSVLQLTADGTNMRVVEHIMDTLDTRFATASHVTTIEMNGIDYVLAAGGDQGISLFAFLDEGRLQHVETIEGSIGTTLQGINGLTATPTSDGARVFVSTDAAPFVVEYSVSLDSSGAVERGTSGDDDLNGGAGNDILFGGDGDDHLVGVNGNDTFQDGAGNDRMSGGNGNDLFIMAKDGQRDVIQGFRHWEDTIDLSGLSLIGGLSNLNVTSFSWGAELEFFGEVLEVQSNNGTSLGVNDFGFHNIIVGGRMGVDPSLSDLSLYDTSDSTAIVLPFPDLPDTPPQQLNRVAAPSVVITPDGSAIMGNAASNTIQTSGTPDLIFGGSGNDIIESGEGNDRISGDGGADVLYGEEGDDTLSGGIGFDTLHGGDGNDLLSGDGNADTLFGGNGDDLLVGGDGYDWLHGEDGNDLLWGGATPDRLFGGDGNDTLYAGSNFSITVDGLWGGAGDDTMFGEAGFDMLNGGEGDDYMDGGHQADNLFGEGGNDIMLGDLGLDRLFGGDGDDIMSGGDGNDGHFGGEGNDIAWGGEGNDRFFGGNGNDVLMGEAGNDTLIGNAGFDVIVGGEGDDELYGNFNADCFVFETNHGHDTVMDFDVTNPLERVDFSDMSGINDFSDVLNAATQVGDDVRIDTSSESSVLLIGVDLGDLADNSFLF